MTKFYTSPHITRGLKCVGVYPRYFLKRRNCRQGFSKIEEQYSQDVLFIAGLSKSGTTWLKKMLTSYPGFHELLIPDVASYELAHGGSHDYELPDDIFSRFENMLVVTKTHVHGSPHSAKLLHDAGVKYIVPRDLRDLAVSHYFYVRQTPWHPEYPIYKDLSVQEGLATFTDRLLLLFADWIRSWHQNRDPELSLELRYEEMFADTVGVMTCVAEHFELDSSAWIVKPIVVAHSFENLSGGAWSGPGKQEQFLLQGQVRGWRCQFTPELKERYKTLVGDFLIEFGYEQDYNW